MSKSRLVSGRAKKKLGTELSSDRYDYLDVSNAEPDLGTPPVDNSVLIGDLDGSRTWTDITEYAEQFKGYTGSKGQGFIIAKTYSSVAALTADTEPSGIAPGEFAIIDTDDVEDPENSKLYLWTGTSYNFVTDLSGEQGIKGETGFTGSQGDIGFTGSQGDVGFTGSQGDIGYTGSQGDIGYTGSQGNIGFTGSAGTDGVIGADGADGATGFTGSQGDLGYTGSAGTDGVIGSDGADGATGFTGSQGDIGYTGSLGESSFTYGPDAPLNPAVGDRWYDSIDGAALVYTNDGDSFQWVEVAASGFLGRTGYTGSASALTELTDVDVSSAEVGQVLGYTGSNWMPTDAGASTSVYVNISELPLSGNETGSLAFVTENNRLYIWNGLGWFNIALINTNPTITQGPDASYNIAPDGTPTVITLIANDPEGLPITWSSQVTTGTLGNTAVITQNNNVFTITAGTDAGNFGVTFTASDGVNIATATSSFTLSFGISATGGTVTTVDGYQIHTFTQSGTFEVTGGSGVIECLIVGGGGGGGEVGGGGGAGGVLYGTLDAVAGSYAVTVGRGQAGAGNGYPGPGPGVTTVAESSSITIGGTTYTAFAGGSGSIYDSPPPPGGTGGSGGGGTINIGGGAGSVGGLATQTTQGALTGYGQNGGAGANTGNNIPYPSGGGGGAGAPGQNATSSRGGAGGAGIVNPIAGSTIGQLVNGQYYIAGGGGGFDDSNFNPGGIGGGGTNSKTFPTDDSSKGTAALPNTGGGGGGGSRQWYSTDGGSGVVIIRHPVSF
jgi:hypothetical protein